MIIKQRINKMKNKFLLKVILLLSLVTPKLFADITQAQLDEYMKVSRAGQVLKFYQKVLSQNTIDMLIIENTTDRESAKVEILELLNDSESMEYFNRYFKKLDNNTYNKIMDFYNSKVGIKSERITSLYFNSNEIIPELDKIFKKCKNPKKDDCFKYLDISKINSLSESKKVLLEKVFKEFDAVKIKRDFRRILYISMNGVFKKNYQYSNEFIEKHSTLGNVKYDETSQNITFMFFKDFTEKELEEIISYGLSDASKKEYKLIEDAIVAYTNEYITYTIKRIYPSKYFYKNKKENGS